MCNQKKKSWGQRKLCMAVRNWRWIAHQTGTTKKKKPTIDEVGLRELVADPCGTHVHSRFIQFDGSPFFVLSSALRLERRKDGRRVQNVSHPWTPAFLSNAMRKAGGCVSKAWVKQASEPCLCLLIWSVKYDPFCHHHLLVLQKKRHAFKSSLGVIIRQ